MKLTIMNLQAAVEALAQVFGLDAEAMAASFAAAHWDRRVEPQISARIDLLNTLVWEGKTSGEHQRMAKEWLTDLNTQALQSLGIDHRVRFGETHFRTEVRRGWARLCLEEGRDATAVVEVGPYREWVDVWVSSQMALRLLAVLPPNTQVQMSDGNMPMKLGFNHPASEALVWLEALTKAAKAAWHGSPVQVSGVSGATPNPDWDGDDWLEAASAFEIVYEGKRSGPGYAHLPA